LNFNFRTGIGFDVHQFSDNRKLIIGGVEIPYEKGLSGHSDADVLLHAICDALLGAAALGDIGMHFPDSAPEYKNVSSALLLQEVSSQLKSSGFSVGNIDSVVMAEKPKLLPYINLMREKISKILNVPIERISIKATTTESLGFVGRKEGIAALATALIIKNK
jgi:2-C-methyl-D-erythritol 2,4-cyclodiphosphate synthase